MTTELQRDSGEPRFRFEEHVGEIAVRAEGATLPALFEEMADALAAVQAPALDGTDRMEAHVELEAPDREALLVAWLNELIFLADTRGRIFECVSIDQLDDRHLRATVEGLRALRPGTPVKAATYHQLRITADDAGFHGQVVLDV